MSTSTEAILVFGTPLPGDGGQEWRGAVGAQAVEVMTAELIRRLGAFTKHLQDAFASIEQRVGVYDVDQIEVAAVVTTTGKVCLLGVGAEASGEASVRLVFRRASVERQ